MFKNLKEIYLESKGFGIKTYKKGNVEFSFYGGELCDVTVDGESIYDLWKIDKSGNAELENRLTEEQIEKLLEMVNEA